MNIGAKAYRGLMAGVAGVLFFGVSQMQGRLNAERQELGFTVLAPLENAPPFLAFTSVALGGFRGLISNALWMRANELQEEDRYFEMVQLTDWISKLTPHFAAVWTHQAWNMAFNISVKFKDPEERWRWVQRGMDLLREGLRYNPGEVTIYKELSWFFRFKIGDDLDDAHMTYKYRWAQQMQDVLGGHPDFAVLLDPRTPEDRERVRKLREVYQMDPAVIQQIDTNFGPLDWRLPGAHAIYWAELGMRTNVGYTEQKDILRRFPAQLMQQTCFNFGALPPWVKKVTPENFILWPNLDMVTNVNNAYLRATFTDPSQAETAKTAQKNFLKDAIVLLYEYNRNQEAAHWFNYMKNNFTNALTPEESTMNVGDYAIEQINANITDLDPKKGSRLVMGLLSQEYLELVAGEDDAAARSKAIAHAFWESYQSRLPNGGDTNNAPRIALPPFEELAGLEYDEMLRELSPESAAILRRRVGVATPSETQATNAPAVPSP